MLFNADDLFIKIPGTDLEGINSNAIARLVSIVNFLEMKLQGLAKEESVNKQDILNVLKAIEVAFSNNVRQSDS
jgi:hypothetical protein